MEDFNTNETKTSEESFGTALAKEATAAVVITAAVAGAYIGTICVANALIKRHDRRQEKKAAKKARKNK